MHNTAKLRIAASEGEVGLVGEMLRAKVPITPDKEGRRALHHAAAGGHTQIVKMLLDGHFCSVDELDVFGMTSLHIAASRGNLQTVHLLVMSGANVNRLDSQHGNSPLHEASWKGYSMTADVLCREGSDANAQNKTLSTPLHLAAQKGHNQTARVLLSAGANPNLRNTFGDTALHTSTRYGHAGVARILLSITHLIRVNIQNKNGDTATHIAAALKRRKIVALLLAEGADVGIRNMQGETAYDVAKRKGHGDIVDLFAATTASSTTSSTPVHSKLVSDGFGFSLPATRDAAFPPSSATLTRSNPFSHYAVTQVDSGHGTTTSSNDWANSRKLSGDPSSSQPGPVFRLVPNAINDTSLTKRVNFSTPTHVPTHSNGTITGPYHDSISAFNSQMTQPRFVRMNDHPSSSREQTPNSIENKELPPAPNSDKPKKKFFLFRLFRRKNKSKSANNNQTELQSESAPVPTVPALVASCHEAPITWYRDLAGNIHQGQAFTSVCTCHLNSRVPGQTCIEHGTKEWHGATDKGSPAILQPAAPYYLTVLNGKSQSNDTDEGGFLNKEIDKQPDLLNIPAPRLYRTRSDESLSMSEYKMKTQEQKRKALQIRNSHVIDFQHNGPQFGRKGAFMTDNRLSNPICIDLEQHRSMNVPPPPARPPRQLSSLHRASPDGMVSKSMASMQDDVFIPAPPSPYLQHNDQRIDRSQTPDSEELRSRNRQAAEKLQRFRDLYSRPSASPHRNNSLQRYDMQTSKV